MCARAFTCARGSSSVTRSNRGGCPPGAGVAGSFGQQFHTADAYTGIPADEVGMPPLTEAEQDAVAREADRIADEAAGQV